MTKFSLKNIVSKKNDASSLVHSLIRQTNAEVFIEDENGSVLLGDSGVIVDHQQPVMVASEIVGWVKGDQNAKIIAELLTVLSQKESEKKKLGS